MSITSANRDGSYAQEQVTCPTTGASAFTLLPPNCASFEGPDVSRTTTPFPLVNSSKPFLLPAELGQEGQYHACGDHTSGAKDHLSYWEEVPPVVLVSMVEKH